MAKRWVTVNVTEDIIKRARRQDCYYCLIALALREATGFSWHVWFESARIEVLCGLNGLRRTWKMPPDVHDAMVTFDAGYAVAPFSFRLPARFADKKWLAYGAGVDD